MKSNVLSYSNLSPFIIIILLIWILKTWVYMYVFTYKNLMCIPCINPYKSNYQLLTAAANFTETLRSSLFIFLHRNHYYYFYFFINNLVNNLSCIITDFFISIQRTRYPYTHVKLWSLMKAWFLREKKSGRVPFLT